MKSLFESIKARILFSGILVLTLSACGNNEPYPPKFKVDIINGCIQSFIQTAESTLGPVDLRLKEGGINYCSCVADEMEKTIVFEDVFTAEFKKSEGIDDEETQKMKSRMSHIMARCAKKIFK